MATAAVLGTGAEGEGGEERRGEEKNDEFFIRTTMYVCR